MFRIGVSPQFDQRVCYIRIPSNQSSNKGISLDIGEFSENFWEDGLDCKKKDLKNMITLFIYNKQKNIIKNLILR